VFRFVKERDWDGQFEGADYQWSFAEALLYSVTVVTTIGQSLCFLNIFSYTSEASSFSLTRVCVFFWILFGKGALFFK